MKCELRALMDLCRSTGVDGEGIVQVRPTTLSRCQRCCREGGYECIEGGVWISNAGKEYMPSPLEAANLLHVVLSNTLFSMLALGVQSLQPIEIACPFLVTYYDSFPDASSGGQCLVIEYMRWGSLQERLASGHVFSTDELALVAYCVLKALAFIAAHAYVHCDIKVRT